MAWYCRITRLLITPPALPRPSTHYKPSSFDIILSHALADIARRCTQVVESARELQLEMTLPFVIEILRDLGSSCTDTLSRVGQGHVLQQYDVPTTQSSSLSISGSQPHRPPTRASRGVGFRPLRVRFTPPPPRPPPPPPRPPPLPPPPT